MYAYDPYGINQDNLVTERFAISATDGNRQVWVPHAAPFFTKDLVIKNLITGDELKYKKDYLFSEDLSVNKRVVESNIYNTVIFITDQNGMYEGTYRTVGGGLVFVTRKYFMDLAKTLLDPAYVLYSHVTNIPKEFPVDHHLHDWSDYRNKHYIANVINGINAAIRAKQVTATTDLSPLVDEINALSKYLELLNLEAHVQEINAHSVTLADLGALPIGASATTALRVYGSTLDQLVGFVREKQTNGVNFDSYIHRDGGSELVKSIIANVLKTPNDESAIYTNSSDLIIRSIGSVDIWANISASGVFTLKAGNNTVTLDSAPYAEGVSSLKLNGIPMATTKILSKLLSTVDLTKRPIVTKSNSTVVLVGDGTTGNRLCANVIHPYASTSTYGIAKYTDQWGTSESLVMLSNIAKSLITDLTGHLSVTRKINGRALSRNIKIPVSDIGLEYANNTSDLDKPISIAQATELAKYANKTHMHNFTPPIATASVFGIAKLYNTWTGSEVGVFSPSVLTKYKDRLVLGKGYKATYNGEAIIPNAIYAVIRTKPMIRRGSEIQLAIGEDYLVIK